MDRPKAYLCLVWLVGVVSAQTGQQGLTRPTPAVLVTPATNRAQLERKRQANTIRTDQAAWSLANRS
jgi:hypothetical protein